MNKTAIRRVALAILTGELAKRKKNPIGFNLGSFFHKNNDDRLDGFQDNTGHNCGTNACIAGWAHFLYDGHSTKSATIATHAREVLGLSALKADALFAPMGLKRTEVTPERAALVLFHLAETGRVDWSIKA